MKEREELQKQIKHLHHLYSNTSVWDPEGRGAILYAIEKKTEEAWNMKKAEDRIRIELMVLEMQALPAQTSTKMQM